MNPTDTNTTEDSNNLSNTRDLLQDIASLGIGLTSIILATGFIVFNAHLQHYTDIFRYNVSLGQYAAAGLAFFTYGIPYLAISGVVMLVLRALLKEMPIIKHIYKSLFDTPRKTTIELARFVMAMLYLVTPFLLIPAGIYGLITYHTIPRHLGGGQPVTVILSLKSEYEPSAFNLSTDVNIPHRTATLLLLAELYDGLLVADPNTGQVVQVYSDAIVGILDDEKSELLIAPTSTHTATLTPVPTETATP